MDDATLSRATDPFFTTKGVGKGTGLGLSMVQGLAEQSGGRLTLDSTIGTGTVAELWLPIAADQSVAPILPAHAGDARPAESAALRVLVVDDDMLVLTNTAAMLEDLGHRVVTAASGPDALALLRRQDIDLLVTDYAMPHMNGIQLLDAARSIRGDLPALIVSGYAELPEGREDKTARIGKPFSDDQLLAGIATAIERQRGAQPSSS